MLMEVPGVKWMQYRTGSPLTSQSLLFGARIGPRTLSRPGKHSTTEVYPLPVYVIREVDERV